MTIHYLLEAELEILAAIFFYKERAGDLALDFYSEFKKSCEEIATFPEFWGSVGSGYRRKLLSRYPYGIIYRIEEEEILIIALAHTSRRPEYWKDRT
jgi:plasmid stabilization system protein ParE